MALLHEINNGTERFSVADDGSVKVNNVYTLPTAVTGGANYVLTAQTDGSTAWAPEGSTGTVTGSGTLNTVPRWTATGSNLGDGPIVFSSATSSANSTFGGDVGIGVAATKALQVSGEALFGNGTDGLLLSYSGTNSSGIIDTGHSSTALEFRVGNTQELSINGTSATFAGNVGIGKSPTEKLDVEGNIQTINTAGSSVAYVDIVSGGTWRFASNPTTGTNAYGLDIIKGSAGTDIKMSIDTNGNVGIGTDSPGYKLEVVKTGADGINVDVGADFGGIRLTSSTGAWSIRTSTGDDLFFYDVDNSNQAVTFERGGNVGIGTASPGGKLHIKGDGDAINLIRLQHDGTGTNGYFDINVTDTEANLIANYSTTAIPMRFLTGATERMRIDSSGRLSLGPDALDIQIDPASTNSGNNLIYMRGNASDDKSSLQMNHYGHADYYIGVGHVADGKFNIANTLTGNDFVIDTSGNVGIGYTGPSKKLSVNGGIIMGNNGTEAGATKIYGDLQRPDAQYFTKRNYTLLAASGGTTYFLARQWHDNINWGSGNINVIIWGVYYGKSQYNKSDFSCRYGYSGSDNDVVANFNPGSMAVPYWTSATTVSGNIEYRDLKIDIPAYQRYSFEIINPGALIQTWDISNTSNNRVYFYPH